MVNGVKIGTEQKAVAMDDSVTIAPGVIRGFCRIFGNSIYNSIDKITFVSTEPDKTKPANNCIN